MFAEAGVCGLPMARVSSKIESDSGEDTPPLVDYEMLPRGLRLRKPKEAYESSSDEDVHSRRDREATLPSSWRDMGGQIEPAARVVPMRPLLPRPPPKPEVKPGILDLPPAKAYKAWDRWKTPQQVAQDQRELARLRIGLDPAVASWPPLVAVAYTGNAAGVQALLRKGADPNVQNRHKATALWYAVGSDNLRLSRLLLDARADPNHSRRPPRTSTWRTILDHAHICGVQDAIIQVLLEAGAKRGADVLSKPYQHMAAGGSSAVSSTAPLFWDASREERPSPRSRSRSRSVSTCPAGQQPSAQEEDPESRLRAPKEASACSGGWALWKSASRGGTNPMICDVASAYRRTEAIQAEFTARRWALVPCKDEEPSEQQRALEDLTPPDARPPGEPSVKHGAIQGHSGDQDTASPCPNPDAAMHQDLWPRSQQQPHEQQEIPQRPPREQPQLQRGVAYAASLDSTGDGERGRSARASRPVARSRRERAFNDGTSKDVLHTGSWRDRDCSDAQARVLQELMEARASQHRDVCWFSVGDLKFRTRAVLDTFTNGPHKGKRVEALLEDLRAQRVRPDELPSIEVASSRRGGLEVLDGHRRLFCLKKLAEELRAPVRIRCIVYKLSSQDAPWAVEVLHAMAQRKSREAGA